MRSEREVSSPRRKKVDARCDREVARRAADEWGVLSTAELLACGLTYPAITRRRQRGRLHQLHQGVYAVGHPHPPWQGRLLAAAKACGPAALASQFSAAALWNFADLDEDRYPDVTVLNGGGGHHAGIQVHRTSALAPRDRARAQGVPVTSPARTLLDLAAIVDERTLRSIVRRAQGERQVNLRQISEVLMRLSPRRGSRPLARVISSGAAPTKSMLEDIVLDLVLNAGFQHPHVNQPLHIDGRRLVPDFRWPHHRIIVEADSATWHDDKLAREDDAERQALLEAHGERVVRVTWAQAVSQPARTLARIRAAGAPLGAGVRPGS